MDVNDSSSGSQTDVHMRFHILEFAEFSEIHLGKTESCFIDIIKLVISS